jgi:hypothetical protein
MNANEAVSKIRLLLGLNEATFTFATAVLVDGTEVKTEGEMVEGTSLMVVTPEGEVAAPAGIHETEGGLLITVDEAGTITAIEEKAAEAASEEEVVTEEVAMEEEVTVEIPEEVAPVMTEEVVQAVVEAIAPIVEEVAAITAELKEMKAKFQAFSAEPAAKKVTRNDFTSERLSAVDRIAKIRKNK